MLESHALVADAAPARSVPPSPVETSLLGAHDVDGAAFSVGSRATSV
jgi:hypothetical protein